MDTKFVITQLVNAVLVVTTTIIVTRLTLKGSIGISEKAKNRLKTIAIVTVIAIWNVGTAAFGIWRLMRFVSPATPPTRHDVFFISGYTSLLTLYAVFLILYSGKMVSALLRFGGDKPTKRNSRHTKSGLSRPKS